MKQRRGWWLPDYDDTLETHFRGDGYQQLSRLCSLQFVKSRRLAIDIGAHVGLWCRDLAGMFNRVIAFEPVPDHRECFVRNVPGPNVTLHPYCLGNSSEARVTMFHPGGSSANTKVHPDFSDGDVEVRRLDDFELGEVDYIKVDTEGYELFVLEGARETLLRNKPVIVIEQKSGADDYDVARYGASEFLKELGAKQLGGHNDDLVFGWN